MPTMPAIDIWKIYEHNKDVIDESLIQHLYENAVHSMEKRALKGLYPQTYIEVPKDSTTSTVGALIELFSEQGYIAKLEGESIYIHVSEPSNRDTMTP